MRARIGHSITALNQMDLAGGFWMMNLNMLGDVPIDSVLLKELAQEIQRVDFERIWEIYTSSSALWAIHTLAMQARHLQDDVLAELLAEQLLHYVRLYADLDENEREQGLRTLFDENFPFKYLVFDTLLTIATAKSSDIDKVELFADIGIKVVEAFPPLAQLANRIVAILQNELTQPQSNVLTRFALSLRCVTEPAIFE